jgi:RNA polymerase sigma factor for flagellar operon FliA
MTQQPLDPEKRSNVGPVTPELLAQFRPIVEGIVAQFVRRLPRRVRREDLLGAGMLGLLQALRDSRHSSEEMLCAYIRIRVRGAIIDDLRRADWSTRRSQKEGVVPVSVVCIEDLPPQAPEANPPSEWPSPFEALEGKRNSANVGNALRRLPEREREVLTLRYFEEVASKDIANRLGVSEARISQIHASGVARLRDMLSDSTGESTHADSMQTSRLAA